jgi:all-trans-retinol 13,14-reductase
MQRRESIVIIGTGMAGLFAGALLAREGLQVTVLEKENTAGGLLASFSVRGVFFDTGLHYLGGLAPGQILWHYFKSLDLFSLCRFEEMDPEGFEEYRFPGSTFVIPTGQDRFLERLSREFPAEHDGLRQCLEDWHRIARNFPLYNLDQTIRPETELDALTDPVARMSLDAYLKEHIRDERLRAVLCANNSLYGVQPDECPVYMHALITDSFLQSAWKVVGPSQNLAKALIWRIEEQGGQVRTHSRVVQILSEQGKARAAVLENGEKLEADWFVSTIHPKQTLSLLEGRAVRPIYRERVESLEETRSVYGLFISLKQPGWPFAKRNVFIHQSLNMQAHFSETWQGTSDQPHSIFLSPTDFEDGRARALSILCPMGWEEWLPWEQTTRASRPPAYGAFKQRVALTLLKRLEEHYPGISRQIDFWQAATPVTFRDYTGTWQGGTYGIKKNCQSLREATLSVRTRLANFFLAGQSIVLPGVVGVTISAVAAAGAILGFQKLIKRFK